MGIEWTKPLWLLLLPVLAVFLGYTAKKGKFPSLFQRRMQTGLRFLVCTLLVLAMAGPQVFKRAEITTTLFALDCSASMKGGTEAADFLREAYAAKGPKDSLGLICFGRRAGVEHSPSLETDPPAEGFVTYTDESATDIAAALKLAESIFPEGTAKRIVLLSDGEETAQNALAQAKQLAESHITADVFPVSPAEGDEVQLTALEVPKAVSRNTEYEIALRIDANVATDAAVRLYQGNTLIGSEKISVSRGETRVVFTAEAAQGGSVTFRGEISPERDTERKNNRAYAYTYVDDIPRILLLGTAENTAGWKALLQGGGAETTSLPPEAAPVTMEGLREYDTVILANTPVPDLPEGFLEILESYVRTAGGGFVASGGEDSFALGGYKGSVLEEILPVEMELKTEGETPDLGMALVIDHSGSMSDGGYGVTRMEMAKEAAIRSLDDLGPDDQIGVIAFDSAAEWVVPMQKAAENRDGITQAIGTIQPAGGTNILPALREAVQGMENVGTKQKHILLLTDGQAEQSGYDGILERMRSGGITLSTVAIGSGADTALMQRLAERGGGRYYFTNEFTDLPEIFAKETLLAGKDYINERSFYPEQGDASAILAGISSVPELRGYIGTTAKSRADKILLSDREEPVLAAWQYGLGRTAAWTADVHGQWTADWLRSREGAAVLRNMVSWTMNAKGNAELQLTAESGTGESLLRLEMPYDETVTGVSAAVAASDGESWELGLQASAPGIFEGSIPTEEEGVYTANIGIEKKDGTAMRYNVGFSIGYPKEYDMTARGDGMAVLGQIAAAAGGRMLEGGADVFAEEAGQSTMHREAAGALLAAAVLLFLADIALRRFPAAANALERQFAKRKKTERKAEKAGEKMPKAGEKTPKAAPVPKQKETQEGGGKPPGTAEAGEAAGAGGTAQRLAAAKKNRRR